MGTSLRNPSYDTILEGDVGIVLTGPESKLHIYGSDNPLTSVPLVSVSKIVVRFFGEQRRTFNFMTITVLGEVFVFTVGNTGQTRIRTRIHTLGGTFMEMIILSQSVLMVLRTSALGPRVPHQNLTLWAESIGLDYGRAIKPSPNMASSYRTNGTTKLIETGWTVRETKCAFYTWGSICHQKWL